MSRSIFFEAQTRCFSWYLLSCPPPPKGRKYRGERTAPAAEAAAARTAPGPRGSRPTGASQREREKKRKPNFSRRCHESYLLSIVNRKVAHDFFRCPFSSLCSEFLLFVFVFVFRFLSPPFFVHAQNNIRPLLPFPNRTSPILCITPEFCEFSGHCPIFGKIQINFVNSHDRISLPNFITLTSCSHLPIKCSRIFSEIQVFWEEWC